MKKKIRKMKIRVERFPYYMKTKRSVGKRTKSIILSKNEITLKKNLSLFMYGVGGLGGAFSDHN